MRTEERQKRKGEGRNRMEISKQRSITVQIQYFIFVHNILMDQTSKLYSAESSITEISFEGGPLQRGSIT